MSPENSAPVGRGRRPEPATMVSTNKYLARSSRSRTGVPASLSVASPEEIVRGLAGIAVVLWLITAAQAQAQTPAQSAPPTPQPAPSTFVSRGVGTIGRPPPPRPAPRTLADYGIGERVYQALRPVPRYLDMQTTRSGKIVETYKILHELQPGERYETDAEAQRRLNPPAPTTGQRAAPTTTAVPPTSTRPGPASPACARYPNLC
jgi:hypothetical protein